ncbi:hypothetical protein [Maribacter sp. HTCC2170]|uniref:hypothetical protein n=1 Tax=Maribacter sp. (strain HTCC2170 / KCCM 42371) TaxID=313603 RepID=UPI00006B1ACE|nr:hypothetical protein [Maribacter sp. HTCC2170]EAR00809.1 hypothetical protein FB2170_17031 [Maribacter sp. HTCC2170]
MEPDKFEKHIKNKLNEREISPSMESWDKISSQLQSPETSKSNRFFWYSIAAAFVGVLLISTIFFNRQEAAINTEVQIVETPKESINIPEKQHEVINQKEVEEKVINAQRVIVQKKINEPREKIEKAIDNDSQIASNEEVNRDITENEIITNTKEQLLNAKIAEVVAQVNLLENSNLPVSSAEVDSLLRKAQQEILTDKIFGKEGKVDAMALLNEVEGELDQSFREQIFETLKEGFLKVRTAVADRNN